MEQQKVDLDGIRVIGDGSNKKSDSEKSESKLSAFTFQAGNASEVD